MSKQNTTAAQFQIMVEFMENNGDLFKPSQTPHGKQASAKKWAELTQLLNGGGVGPAKTEEKWRKGWSDYKNFVKKKAAKLNQSHGGTGGGPPLSGCLTDLEERVLGIINIQAAIGIKGVDETGLPSDRKVKKSRDSPIPEEIETEEILWTNNTDSSYDIPMNDTEVTQDIKNYTNDSEWNTPGSSQMPTVRQSIKRKTSGGVLNIGDIPGKKKASDEWQQKSRKQTAEEYFCKSQEDAREYERERDRILFEFERDRMRQRDRELDQRDMELRLKFQWAEIMSEIVSVVKKIFESKKDDDSKEDDESQGNI